MFSGLLNDIPAGWALCDGENGTPDLRGVFIKGSEAGIDPGVTGGAATHTHGVGTYVADAHAGAAVDDHASHTHDVASQLADPDLFASDVTGAGVSGQTGGPSATLSHMVTQPSAHTLSGDSGAADNDPVFFSLAFIMYLQGGR
jgi:microcystin-dependent protein